MRTKFLISILLFTCELFYNQKINKIEFHHSNSIILFKSVNIVLEPIKNNKKGKVKVFVQKDRDEKYVTKISKDKFFKICDAIRNIKCDTIAVKHTMIDGSLTSIIINNNLGNENNYHATGLNKESQTNEFQKDFWYVTKLILKAAQLKMEDLIDYR